MSKCGLNTFQSPTVTHSVCFSFALVDVKQSLLQNIFIEFCAFLRMAQRACTALENWLLKRDFMHFRHKNNKCYIKKSKLCFIILLQAPNLQITICNGILTKKSCIIFRLNGIMSYPCICRIVCHIHGTMWRATLEYAKANRRYAIHRTI